MKRNLLFIGTVILIGILGVILFFFDRDKNYILENGETQIASEITEKNSASPNIPETIVIPGCKSESFGKPILSDDISASQKKDSDSSSANNNNTVSKSKGENKKDTVVEYTVRFFDYDNSELDSQKVKRGESAVVPSNPQRAGYEFIGWDKSVSNVTSNMTVKAQYKEDTTPLIIVEDRKVKSGENDVSIVISVKNNPGILGMILTLTYDDTVMTLKKAVNGGIFNGVLTLTKSKKLCNGCSFVWDGESVVDNQIKDGEILILDFDISDSAPVGKYTVAVSYQKGDIIDNDLKPLDFSIDSGKITIEK